MVSWLLAFDALHVAVHDAPPRPATVARQMQYHVLPFVVEEQHGVDSVTRRTAACTSSCWRRRRRAGRSCSTCRTCATTCAAAPPAQNPPTRTSASVHITHHAPHGTRTRA